MSAIDHAKVSIQGIIDELQDQLAMLNNLNEQWRGYAKEQYSYTTNASEMNYQYFMGGTSSLNAFAEKIKNRIEEYKAVLNNL